MHCKQLINEVRFNFKIRIYVLMTRFFIYVWKKKLKFFIIYIFGGGGGVDDGAEFEVTQDGEITHLKIKTITERNEERVESYILSQCIIYIFYEFLVISGGGGAFFEVSLNSDYYQTSTTIFLCTSRPELSTRAQNSSYEILPSPSVSA